MGKKRVYMDNNATTPLHPEVKQAIREGMDVYGNASSYHEFGRKARARIDRAREHLASFINAEPDELIFVGSGSEANNTVLNIFSLGCATCDTCRSSGNELITTKIEHPCILESSKCLVERGLPVQYLEVNETGLIDIEELQNAISAQTGIVSVMMANNEIGTLQDIKAITGIVHENGALMHTDAVQALGKVPIDVKELDVDFMSFSAHKIYGPKGIGSLYVKKGTPFCPLIHGGHQEQGRRAGTENTLGIIGFGKAVEMLGREMKENNVKIQEMRDTLKQGLLDSIPDITVNGSMEHCVPNTLNVSFKGAEGEAILLYLDLEGIGVSTGSACSSGNLDPSHVLLATGVEAEQAHGSIRFSLGRENTTEDVDYVLKKLPPIIEKIRNMSTAYGGENDE